MTNQFSDNREKYLGMSEAAAGIGTMVGPVIGSVLYAYFGYFWAFIFFAVMLGFSGILSFFILSNSLNDKVRCSDNEKEEGSQTTKVPYSWFFTDLRCVFSLLTCAYVCVIFSFSSSFFTPALLKEKHVPEVYHGVIVSISPIFYVGFTILVGYIIDKFPKRIFILVSFGGCALAMLVTGPSYLLGMPNKLWLLCIGQALQGTFLGLIFIPIMPEMIEALYESR